MNNPITLGLGEQAVSSNPEDVLVAYGLGSCLGISMVDPFMRVAGLIHAVLPEGLNGEGKDPSTCSKYVDSGIESLLALMAKEGANRSRIIIRMVGGANMLVAPGLTSTFDIGTRNIEKARTTFQRLNMKIAAEEVGGHTGRTIRVYVADSRVTVRVIGEKEHEI
ncbi:MAG: chemotaxis protein CheD [Anaerolineales bacterium]